MISAAFQSRMDAGLSRVARVIARTGLTPNHLTLTGLLINLLAAYFFSQGRFTLGGLLMIPGGCLDFLDGPLARVTGNDSRMGSMFDSVADRYSDLAVLIGITMFYVKGGRAGTTLLAMIVMVGFILVPYARARAESLVTSCRVGIMERGERWFLLGLGAILNQMPVTLLVLAALTHFTVAQRLHFTWRELKRRGG